MNKSLISLTFFLFCLSVLSCTSENDFPSNKPYPFVLSDNADVDNAGVTMRGSILNSNELQIKSVGFVVIGITLNPQEIQISYESQDFEYKLDFDIPAGKEFSYRAFAKTQNYTTYGNTLNATSKGFVPPTPNIDSISNHEVAAGSNLKIYGSRFSQLNKNLEIYVGDIEALILGKTLNEIEILVPNGLSIGTYTIYIISYGKESNRLEVKI